MKKADICKHIIIFEICLFLSFFFIHVSIRLSTSRNIKVGRDTKSAFEETKMFANKFRGILVEGAIQHVLSFPQTFPA